MFNLSMFNLTLQHDCDPTASAALVLAASTVPQLKPTRHSEAEASGKAPTSGYG
jgi:hypothetical protein